MWYQGLCQSFTRVYAVLAREVEGNLASSRQVQNGREKVQEAVARSDQRVWLNGRRAERPEMHRVRDGNPTPSRHGLNLVVAVSHERGPLHVTRLPSAGVVLLFAPVWTAHDEIASAKTAGKRHEDGRDAHVCWLQGSPHAAAFQPYLELVSDRREVMPRGQGREQGVAHGFQDGVVGDLESRRKR